MGQATRLPERPPALLDWATEALQPHLPAAHHRLLLDRFERLSAGDCDRLLVCMPPGSAKSTYCSVLLPPWWLARHSGHEIIAASHTESLVAHFGRRARALVAEHKTLLSLDLARDDRAAGRWSVSSGGSYFAAGVHGPIVGRRADLILIDDPIKGHAEAVSANARDSLWQWYQADLLPRLKPGGRIVLVMTRWHLDDLAGRLLSGPDKWDELRLPALAEGDDPLGRTPGAPLWPALEDAPALARRRASVGERKWQALYQQQPQPDSGTLFKPDMIAVLDAAPPGKAVRAWDLAATEATDGGDPDWTVGLKLGSTGQGYCVLDVKRFRGGPLDVERTILQTANTDGRAVPIGIPQDPGQAGKQQVAHLSRLLKDFAVNSSPETGSKITRATPVSAAMEAGLISTLRGDWTADLLDELRSFPLGRKDDQVDALSRAFALLGESGAQTRRLQVNLLGR